MSEMRRKTKFFFAFPSASNFGLAKVTKNREQNKMISHFFAEMK